MKRFTAVALAGAMIPILAACASTQPARIEPTQKVEVQCVATNVAPSRCTTSHTLAVSFSFSDLSLPSVDDLEAEQSAF